MKAVWGLACVLCTVSGHPVPGLLAAALLVAVWPCRSAPVSRGRQRHRASSRPSGDQPTATTRAHAGGASGR